jgi:hypothetical protein
MKMTPYVLCILASNSSNLSTTELLRFVLGYPTYSVCESKRGKEREFAY